MFYFWIPLQNKPQSLFSTGGRLVHDALLRRLVYCFILFGGGQESPLIFLSFLAGFEGQRCLIRAIHGKEHWAPEYWHVSSNI